MQIRPEFKQFIGSSSWGQQKGFYEPTSEELEAQAFQLPVDESLYGPISRSHLDFLNIGHNAQDFNKLSPEVRARAQEVAERGGTWGEIQEAHPEQGKLACIHMSNVADAHKGLIGTMLGPHGPALAHFMEALAEKTGVDGLASLRIGVGGVDMVAGDVYQVTPQEYMGSKLNGVTGEPVARVYIDMTNGTSFLLPDDKFRGA